MGSFEMFSECLNSKSKTVSADRLFQTVAELCRNNRSAKAEWARFTTSRFWFSDRVPDIIRMKISKKYR